MTHDRGIQMCWPTRSASLPPSCWHGASAGWAVVVDVVISVAGGRAKRRKLAQELSARPAVLTDGRSPAPRVIGDLLIALRRAGATVISPPVCAGCGKSLRTMQRRGQDWYCGVCGPRREPCGLAATPGR